MEFFERGPFYKWQGPMSDIQRACEAFGIDMESADAQGCATCKYQDEPIYMEPCLVCIHNSVGSMWYPWTPTFGEWIPVSRRLPDTDEMVLVTAQPKKGKANINRAYYSDGFWHGSGSMSNVTAWMPLPEPYEVKDDDD